jgi:hypothetical protein
MIPGMSAKDQKEADFRNLAGVLRGRIPTFNPRASDLPPSGHPVSMSHFTLPSRTSKSPFASTAP